MMEVVRHHVNQNFLLEREVERQAGRKGRGKEEDGEEE
jgi:hypothetical protein